MNVLHIVWIKFSAVNAQTLDLMRLNLCKRTDRYNSLAGY